MRTNPAIEAEIRHVENEINVLLAESPNLTQSQRKRGDLLLAKLSLLKGQRNEAIQTRAEAAEQRAWRSFLSGAPDSVVEMEARAAMEAGSQTPSWTQGALGGYLVPSEFAEQVIVGLAQVDPLFDESVVNLVREDSYKLPPYIQPAWDLTSITAVRVDENVQHNADAVPPAAQKLLGKFPYRLTIAFSVEWDQDQKTFASAEAGLARAFAVGFARGIGADLVNGNGSTAPAGLLTNAANSGVTTAAAGAVAADDITSIYFSLNRVHRASPRCAWVVSDAVYEMIRKAKDSSNRPLLNVAQDVETLMGKPLFVAPSMPSAAGSKGILFGDLGAYTVHASALYMRRRTQLPGYIENGLIALTGLLQVDAALVDPSAGSVPPVVYATLHV